jgi:hypothetical protein
MGTGGMMDEKVNKLLFIGDRPLSFLVNIVMLVVQITPINKMGYVYCLFTYIVLAEADYPSNVGTRVKH